MWEKNEKDFSLSYCGDSQTFNIYVGTWSNSGQSFADCLFYLSLSDDSLLKGFLEELNKYNSLFIDNKATILEDIETKGLNLLNSCLNESEINDILSELSFSDEKEGILKKDSYYNVDYKKINLYIETQFKKDIINTLKESENIKDAYKNLMQLKKEMQEDFYSNIWEFIFIDK